MAEDALLDPKSFEASPSDLPAHQSDAAGDIIRRYRALVDVEDAFSHDQNLPQLFADLACKLKFVVCCDLVIFAMHDAMQDAMQLTLIPAEGDRSEMTASIKSSLSGRVWEKQQALIIAELSEEVTYRDRVNYLRALGMQSACLLPLSVPKRRLGAIGFASRAGSAYRQGDLEFLHMIAGLVALAVDNVLSRQALQEDKQNLETLLTISETLSSSLDLEKLLPVISDSLRRVLPVDHASISIADPHRHGVHLYRIHPPSRDSDTAEFLADSLTTPAVRNRKPVCYSRSDLESSRSSITKQLFQAGMQCACCFPLITSHGVIGTLNVASSRTAFRCNGQGGVLSQVANNIAMALENAKAYAEIAGLKNRLAEEKLYLEDEIRTELNFEEIIGDSCQLKRALTDARTVASSAANVLILGETGTGKELIARAIHKMSGRKDNSFIKLNCAAIPTGLLESELFGHEKGAFTGAISQKIGRMELANHGTLFLDEVGDIPLDLGCKSRGISPTSSRNRVP